jgi:soluble lytic murein transglycosylase
MQVMPGTSADPGFGVTPARNNTPGEFNRVGREYIDAMVREFGSEVKGAAAYNYGPGNFRRLLRQHPNDWFQHLPPETQDYLRRQGLVRSN